MFTGPCRGRLSGGVGHGCEPEIGVQSATTVLSRLPVDGDGDGDGVSIGSGKSGDVLNSISLGENNLLNLSRIRFSEPMWSTYRDGIRSTVSRYGIPVVTSIEYATARFMPSSDPQTTSATGG